MKPTCLLSLLALLLAPCVFAQTAAPETAETEPATPSVPKVVLTPAQTAHILKELEKIEAQIGQGRSGLFSAALTKFREGMASDSAALALYLDCYRLEHFERKNLKQSDFTDWRDRNETRLKDDDFKKALLLQLEYLVLSIQAQDIKEMKKMAPLVTALQAFIGKAITAVQGSTKHSASGAVSDKDAGPKGGGGRKGGGGGGGGGPGADLTGVLRQAVTGSEFATAYQLGDHLDKKDWDYRPLDVEGIYSKVILPYYLSEKPTELSAQWDARINAEVALRKALMSETEFNLFLKDEGPRMQWAKNNYLVSNNVNAINALADMLKIIQNYPGHPDAMGWLKDFRSIVKDVSEPEAGPTPAETPIGGTQ
ncbi:hypothetical protein [Prosthecobacter sp.]|uniref:hypothetical protein n=1 Tax=Prosthecobacter sp. TaxID=1965333 RepID=UPI001D79FB34|nr:hypothetical protein [Prosthecobacter sp.]MCB1278823.1 hypothetical protein [Prosthecobacter sp.]